MENSLDSLTLNLLQLWQRFVQQLPLIALGLLLLAVFAVLAGPLSRRISAALGLFRRGKLISVVLQRAIQALVILLGLYIFLRLSGLTDFAVAVVGSTGVLGIILGFAFRDIAENFIASLLLSVQQPFRLNDVIEINGHTGVVQKVTARATTLVDFDGNHIQIPNATVYKNIIRNLTANPRMRGHFSVGIGYDSSIPQAQSVAQKILREHFAVLADPEPQVLVSALGSSTVNLDIYFWINSESHSIVKVGSILMRLVVREFTAAGISMPDDNRELIFPEGIRVTLSEPGATEGTATAESGESRPVAPAPAESGVTEPDAAEDVDSEAHDIRSQAASAPAPEEGRNIL